MNQHSFSILDNNSGVNNARSILDEILRSNQFHSDMESLRQPTVSNLSESSYNMFEGVHFGDSLLSLSPKMRNQHKQSPSSLNNAPSIGSCVVDGNLKAHHLEELLFAKDTAIAVLTAEVESLRELTSNDPSILSCNTSSTEYKQLQEEFQEKVSNHIFYNMRVYHHIK